LGRTRVAEQPVPGVGPDPHRAGQAGFEVAEFHRADQRRKVGAERSHRRAIVRPRIDRHDQEDRGAGEGCRYRLWHSHGVDLREVFRVGAWPRSCRADGMVRPRAIAYGTSPWPSKPGPTVLAAGGLAGFGQARAGSTVGVSSAVSCEMSSRASSLSTVSSIALWRSAGITERVKLRYLATISALVSSRSPVPRAC